MVEKIKKIFKEENKSKQIEKLISFLVILVITLIIINRIINENKTEEKKNIDTIEFVNSEKNEDELEEKLKNILSKISGVGKIDVLITYNESGSIYPLYNENSSLSTTKEDSKIIETQSTSKEILLDSTSAPIIQKNDWPKIEGAIVIAEGAKIAEVKNNIIQAVEAATGLATHKIQVFEMSKEYE